MMIFSLDGFPLYRYNIVCCCVVVTYRYVQSCSIKINSKQSTNSYNINIIVAIHAHVGVLN